MSPALREQLAMLPDTLGSHVSLTLMALGLALLVTMPVAVAAVANPRLRGPVLGLVGAIQTIPALALLALMVPLLAGLGHLLGLDIPALGLLPALLALSAYALLPLLRNGVTGLVEVDPRLLDAGRALGMTDRQLLWQVRLPLGLPVLVAGLRTATVWTVGMATLGTPVGQTCLGNHIFAGLQTRNQTAVLVGCLAAAGLAMLLDALIGLAETGLRRRSRGRVGAASVALAVVLMGGLALPMLGSSRPADQATAVRIGAKTFTEQYILAGLLQRRLEAAGIPASRKEGLGSTIVFDALAQDQLDLYVDYSGTLWANELQRTDTASRQDVLDATAAWLAQRDIHQLGSLGFENAYALAMRRTEAQARGINTIADLTRHAPDLAMGADYEFFSRPEWVAVRDGYGLAFAAQRTFDPTLMMEAIVQGDVDVVPAYTSDGRIAAFDLVVLEDPKQALPPYDAVLLLGADAAARPEVVAALQGLVGAIDVQTMQQANAMVDLDGATVTEAVTWLEAQLSAP